MAALARHLTVSLAYEGTAYSGWQRQRTGIDTVASRLEQALTALDGAPVVVRGAGRTDAGVHAAAQVADFNLQARIPTARLPLAVNRLLPRDIVVTGAWEVPEDFHARFSVETKRYRYLVWTDRILPPFVRRYVWHYPGFPEEPPDPAVLLGCRDFRSFAGNGGAVEDTIRTVVDCVVWRRGPLVGVEIEADGFLYHMVRTIVGTLAAGADLGAVLAASDRRRAGRTAPPEGLCLVGVRYPARFGLSVPVLDTPGSFA